MSTKKGYWIALLNVSDPDTYRLYVDAIGDATSAYGARYVVRAGQATHPEDPGFSRHVVVEFESYQTALDCYQSPAYQRAVKDRLAAATGHFVIVEGV